MLPYNFIFLFIFASTANAVLLCYRQPLIGRQHGSDVNVVEMFTEMEEYSCDDPRGVFCLEATDCQPMSLEERIYNLKNHSIFKHDIRDCLSPVIYYAPKGKRQKEIKAENACVEYYQPVRGCQKCRICNKDLCNQQFMPTTTTMTTITMEPENMRGKRSADNSTENFATRLAFWPIGIYLMAFLGLYV